MNIDQKRAVSIFIYPLIIQQLAVTILNMVYSSVVGTISKSALAATSTVGQVITIYSSLFSLVSIGGTVLTARMIGAHEYRDAGRTIEQSLFMTLVYSAIVTVFSITMANPLMNLLIPNADPVMLREAVNYLRQSSITLPFLYLHTIITGILQSSGNSRTNMYINIIMYISLVAFAIIFIKWCDLGITGASLTLGLFRVVGAVLAIFSLLRSHASFIINIKNVLKPDLQIIKRMLRLGLPASAESLFVQLGYLLANTLVMGLGVHQAAIYSVANTIQGFANMPQGIVSAATSTFVGQYLGAKRYDDAKKFVRQSLMIGVPIILALYLIMNLVSPWVTPLYTSDPEVAKEASRMLWILFLFAIPGQFINNVDPALRSGGDIKYVLCETMTGVWLVRLPLSWLLAYHFDMGVVGIYLANIISLYVRATIGFVRYLSGKWMYKRV